MALTSRRWAMLAIAGCALIWFAALFESAGADRPTTNDNAYWYFRGTPARALLRQLSQANDHLRLLELRDSVARVPHARPADGLVVLFDDGLREATRARIEERLRSRWRALVNAPRVPVVVAVVVDSSKKPHGLPRSGSYGGIPIETFLPSPETAGECVALVHLAFSPDESNVEYARQTRANLISPETMSAIMSPCAFYAEFGRPGREVAHWLAATNWSMAGLASWDKPATPWTPLVSGDLQITSVVAAIALQTDPSWQVRRYVGPTGIACMAGRSGACAALLSPPVRQTDSSWRASVASTSGTNRMAFYLPQGANQLGPSAGTVVSEMARTLGPERFERFWSSPKAMSDAFASASGTSLDSWMREWAIRSYGHAASGPDVAPIGLLAGITTMIVGCVLALAIGHRRRVI